MAVLRSLATSVAAAALVSHVHAWNIDLPPCLAPFKPFVYSGCYQDGSPAALSFRSDEDSQTMTTEKCMAECKGNGYRYAGLEYYGICFCGNTVAGAQLDESQCTFPCTGNNSQTCGGNNILSIYQDPTFLPIDDVTIDEYVPLGCWTDDSSQGRALSWPQDQVNGASLTTEKCLSACRDGGYPFAGTEYGGECWCGTVIGNFSQSAPESDCSMTCNGDSSQTCGGRSRLTLYVAKELESLEPCGYEPPTTTPPVTSATPTPTSSACVTTTTVPSHCEYGCGKWCSNELPDWDDAQGCKSSHSSCKLQIAACLKNAGWPGAMDCFDFAGWCSDIGNYCSTGRKRTFFNKKDCFSKKPPRGGKPPTTKTITVPCEATTTTTTKPTTTSTQCPIPTVTNICKQPTSNKDGYGPGNPVGGVELPVVTCNDLRDEHGQKPFKLYTDSNSRRCGGYPRNSVPSACADACKAQYDDCVDVYAEGCKAANGGSGGKSWWDSRGGWGPNGYNNGGHGGSGGVGWGNNNWGSNNNNNKHGGSGGWWKRDEDDKSYFDYASEPEHAKRTFGWNDNYSSAKNKCKAQYDDCLSENKHVTVNNNKCKHWGSGW